MGCVIVTGKPAPTVQQAGNVVGVLAGGLLALKENPCPSSASVSESKAVAWALLQPTGVPYCRAVRKHWNGDAALQQALNSE